jgi:hypothetical protein
MDSRVLVETDAEDRMTDTELADELEYQVDALAQRIGDLPPTGGLGWATLRLPELLGVLRRISRALREKDTCNSRPHNSSN